MGGEKLRVKAMEAMKRITSHHFENEGKDNESMILCKWMIMGMIIF